MNKFTGKGNSLAGKHKDACNRSSQGAGRVGIFGELAGGIRCVASFPGSRVR
jgi:hypothetical protein